MLNKIFEKLNLNQKHAKIYLSLVEDGSSTVGKLSKKLNIPRSTLYGFLYELLNEGLVNQSEKNDVKIWQAESPDKLNHKVNEKINTLEEAKVDLASLIINLKDKQKTDFISPKFTYNEGAEALKQMLKDVLMYRDIETIAFWPINEMIKTLGKDFFLYSNKERIKRNISAKVIWPANKQVDLKENIFLGSGKDFKREIKIAPEGVDCSMGYWAYENKVVFLSSKKESFGFIVESIELKQLLKTQFDILWNLSTPIKTHSTTTKKFIEQL
jgi:HTH-type transcriptional regulator, sugar sensing transcriptional regulator